VLLYRSLLIFLLWKNLYTSDDLWEVERYILSKKTDNLVLLKNTSKESNSQIGDRLDCYRSPSALAGDISSIWIKTGQVEILSISPHQAIAKVLEEGSQVHILKKYPGIMTGDLVTKRSLKIKNISHILQEIRIDYRDLFKQPLSSRNFELSISGKENLEKLTKTFARRRVSKLIIEAYTDRTPHIAEAQFETYQRAQSIRQHLIDRLDFDPKRLVSAGFGDLEISQSAPGVSRRYIIFKALR